MPITIDELIRNKNVPGVKGYLENNAGMQESDIQRMIDTARACGNFSAVAEIAQRYRFTSGSHFDQALFDAVLALASVTTESEQHAAALAAVNALLLAGTPTTYYRQNDPQYRHRDPRGRHPLSTQVPTSYFRPGEFGPSAGHITITYCSIYDLLVTMQDSAQAWVPFLKFAQHKEFKYEKSREAKLSFSVGTLRGLECKQVELTGRTLLGDAEQIAISMRDCSDLILAETQKKNGNQNFCSLTIAKQGGNPRGATPIAFTSDQVFNREILQAAVEQYAAQKNIFKEILGYFAKSYRPTNNDYKTRFDHFAGILAQMKNNPNEMPQITEQDLKRFRATSYCLFTGSQRYLDLIKELQETPVTKLVAQYKQFAIDQNAYLQPGSYFQLAEKIAEVGETLTLVSGRALAMS